MTRFVHSGQEWMNLVIHNTQTQCGGDDQLELQSSMSAKKHSHTITPPIARTIDMLTLFLLNTDLALSSEMSIHQDRLSVCTVLRSD